MILTITTTQLICFLAIIILIKIMAIAFKEALKNEKDEYLKNLVESIKSRDLYIEYLIKQIKNN